MPRPSHPRRRVAKLEEKINRTIERTKRPRISVKRDLKGSSAIYSFENVKMLAEMNRTVKAIVSLF